MVSIEFWLFAAMILSISGYGFYWLGIRRQLVRPNRSSWLIWSAVTTIEALTYQALNEGLAQNIVFFVSAASCLFITLAIWRQSAWQRPSDAELICIAIALGALIIWFGFQSQFWAHVLVVAAVPVSFLPTWISAWQDKRRELSPAWGLWALGDFATLMLILSGPRQTGTDLPYIIIELVCHASIWLMIGLASINPLRSLGVPVQKFLVRDVDKNTRSPFRVAPSSLGKAVYATRAFAIGSTLMEFTGPRYHASEVHSNRWGEDDRFVQIDVDHYMGPSGGLDDLVNHSCHPNAGLRFTNEGVFLIAIRPIQQGDEVCWDYSTTLSNTSFYMRCQCGAPQCRQVIGDFAFLEPDLQERYRALNLVPTYLRNAMVETVAEQGQTLAA
jgi:SET domain